MTVHPQIIERKGKREFVVLPYGEFIKMQRAIEDVMDLKQLRSAKAASKNQSSVSLRDAAIAAGL